MKILLVVLLIALVVYGITRAIERRGVSRPARRQPPRVAAPDDDPEFLRDLEQRKRRERREQERDRGPDTENGAGEGTGTDGR